MKVNLETDICELLMLGFQAQDSSHEHFQILKQFNQSYKLGGVILFHYNIQSPPQTRQLIADLKTTSSSPLFIAVDQEGGKVQRLTAAKNFIDHKSAESVACDLSLKAAYEHYVSLATMLKETGINFNFAPCVDLNCKPPCPVIGALGRSYSSDSETVVNYAKEFIKAHRAMGINTTLKHFPGHGYANADTHHGFVDITNTWKPIELEPYRKLMAQKLVDSVMLAHVTHRVIDPDSPASLSPVWIEKLRSELGFKGLVVTDCLHMGAIAQANDLEQTIIKALRAGVDLLVFSNNPAAAAGILTNGNYQSANGTRGQIPDPHLPAKFRSIVLKALDRGELNETALIDSILRVQAAKSVVC